MSCHLLQEAGIDSEGEGLFFFCFQERHTSVSCSDDGVTALSLLGSCLAVWVQSPQT